MGRRNKRAARCIGCRQLPECCFCPDIPLLHLRTRLLVVMHKSEQTKTTNTGWLAARAMGGTVHVRGDRLRPVAAVSTAALGNAVVLFPSINARPLEPGEKIDTLIVADGTWSQARRIVRREEAIAVLPRVTIPPVGPSLYGLRGNQRKGGLATMEAIAHAIGILEGEAAAAPLHALFARMVRAGMQSRGTEHLLAAELEA